MPSFPTRRSSDLRRRFLEPLGLADTAFETSGLDSARIATGHRLADRTDATRFEAVPFDSPGVYGAMRSEEHTSELQSRGHLVCRLLLEKQNISADVAREGE